MRKTSRGEKGREENLVKKKSGNEKKGDIDEKTKIKGRESCCSKFILDIL